MLNLLLFGAGCSQNPVTMPANEKLGIPIVVLRGPDDPQALVKLSP